MGGAVTGAGPAIGKACGIFLAAKEVDMDAGRLTWRTFREHLGECKLTSAALRTFTLV